MFDYIEPYITADKILRVLHEDHVTGVNRIDIEKKLRKESDENMNDANLPNKVFGTQTNEYGRLCRVRK